MDSLAALDRMLERHGTTITITRNVLGSTPMTTTARGFVRGYQPEELTDDIYQDDRKAIVSPTGLAFVPRRTDNALIAGVVCSVEAANAIMDGDNVVRIELQVRG